MAGTEERFRTSNLCEHLTRLSVEIPDKKAVVCYSGRRSNGDPIYRSLTYRELEEETNRYAHGLTDLGMVKDMRTILMVTPSPEFFALTFALLKVGAVLVLIDPGMGRKKLISSLSHIEAQAYIGTPLAHVLRIMSPSAFRSLKIKVTVGKRYFWGGKTIEDIRSDDSSPFESAKRKPNDKVGIFFTSGSTGPPKGVVYEHSMFDAQIKFLSTHFGYVRENVDLATFPLFSLFDVSLGMTSVVPDMDATKPAQADPRNIVRAIKDNRCTNVYGSPALLNNLARYGIENGIKLETVKRIVTAGAPIRPDLLERLHRILPDGSRIHTPYGATEALPVADISSDRILEYSMDKTAKGAGTCVGKPLEGNEVRIIGITDSPIDDWSGAGILGPGEIGEICVKGPTVTKEYYRKPEPTRAAKISDGGEIWHRMGDTGYVDDDGNIWFCGRKAHRVTTEKGPLYPIRCEAIFNQHPRVFRSSLVGVGDQGRQRPVIIIELEKGEESADKKVLTDELLKMGGRNPLTRDIRDILYQDSFPVDIRHNAKIFREKQARWARGQLR